MTYQIIPPLTIDSGLNIRKGRVINNFKYYFVLGTSSGEREVAAGRNERTTALKIQRNMASGNMREAVFEAFQGHSHLKKPLSRLNASTKVSKR